MLLVYYTQCTFLCHTFDAQFQPKSKSLSSLACSRHSWCRRWNRYVWNGSQWHAAARIYVWRVDFYLHVTACHLNMLDTFSCKNGVGFFFSRWAFALPPLFGMGDFVHGVLHIPVCPISGGLSWSPEAGAGCHPGPCAGEVHILPSGWTREDNMADNAVDQIREQQ